MCEELKASAFSLHLLLLVDKANIYYDQIIIIVLFAVAIVEIYAVIVLLSPT